jgi:hypothetical protein
VEVLSPDKLVEYKEMRKKQKNKKKSTNNERNCKPVNVQVQPNNSYLCIKAKKCLSSSLVFKPRLRLGQKTQTRTKGTFWQRCTLNF